MFDVFYDMTRFTVFDSLTNLWIKGLSPPHKSASNYVFIYVYVKRVLFCGSGETKWIKERKKERKTEEEKEITRATRKSWHNKKGKSISAFKIIPKPYKSCMNWAKMRLNWAQLRSAHEVAEGRGRAGGGCKWSWSWSWRWSWRSKKKLPLSAERQRGMKRDKIFAQEWHSVDKIRFENERMPGNEQGKLWHEAGGRRHAACGTQSHRMVAQNL